MEAKFTKGEWVVKGASMSMGSNYRGKFTVESSGFSGNISEASIANAHLIAAAPEMYEYLSHMVEHEIINDPSIEREVKSLLAKARGE